MTKNEQIINRILKGTIAGYHPFTFLNNEYKMFTNGYYALGSEDDFWNEVSDKYCDFYRFFLRWLF